MVQLRDDIVGHRRRDHHESAGVGGLAATSAGFSDPMVDCRNCKLRFRADDLKGPPSGDRLPELREARHAHRGAPVQPHVQHPRRTGGGVRIGRLPASRDRAGDVRQLRQRGDHHAPQAAVRDRPDRRAASATRSRRATSSSATASSSRWRWSTSSTRATRTSGSPTGSTNATAGGPMCSASTPTTAAPAAARPRRALALQPPDDRHRVRLPDRAGPSWRASRTAPTTT